VIDVDAGMTFLDFVVERHKVWEKRQHDKCQPWTDDPILNSRKFTNVFRWLDPGSQFVITDLLEPGLPPEEFLFRCFLYRHTGRIEVWQFLEVMMGGYPLIQDLEDVREIFKIYKGETKVGARGNEYGKQAGRPGREKKTFQRPLFTSAYLVFPQSSTPGTDKMDSIIDLTKRLFVEQCIYKEFLVSLEQRRRFAALRNNKGVADFMSMQVLTDFGYSTEFRENDFVVLGPGARKGATALLGPYTGKLDDVLEWAWKTLVSHPEQPMVGDRRLSLMDVQNCLCEFSKYVRFASKPSPEKLYTPAHPGLQSKPVLPPLWRS
jgi:hypothetical protein